MIPEVVLASQTGRLFNYNEPQKSVSNQATDEPISITINGEAASIKSGLNIFDLIVHLGLDPARVAVEMNRSIVRRPAWQTTPVTSGAQFEIVTFVGGG